MLSNIWNVTKKELRDYFSSSVALLFLGIFLIAIYIVFFWVEAFFARNLADLRQFFNWIPILFIFLISALTMHSWSEERRMGTIELLLTSPVSPWTFLIGKFFAVLTLIIVALALTIPLPITISYLGELDWGPIVGGYIAGLFLAASYIAIGLWASSQTENQIISLLISIVVCSILYVLGSNALTSFFSYEVSEWLRAFGSGSRFESITRGILDFRDIFYYLTIVVIFLLFARYKLESLRWSNNLAGKAHNYWVRLTTLVVTLFLSINIGLSFVTQARIDLTQGDIYSLSNATKEYLDNLDEPLLIRGYFSSSTHPLLAPLVPRVRDLINEYEILGKGNIQVEFVDPKQQVEFEEEAGIKYGIRPVSFHSESKYQASVINTYFNVLIAQGDQYEVLNYKDLVDLKASAGKHEVDLNNPEYRITRAIRTIVSKASQEIDSFKESANSIVLTGYVSPRNTLPQSKVGTMVMLEDITSQLMRESNDNFDFLLINPDNDQLTQEYLQNELGVKPNYETDVSTQPYWFYFTLTDGKNTVPVTFSGQANKSSISQKIFAAYKRLLPDSVKTIALMRPMPTPGPAGIIESPGIPKHYSILRKSLQQSVNVIDVDLRDGVVPSEIDFLMILAQRYLHPVQIAAIKDYLKNGGNVLISSSSIDVSISHFTEVYSVRSGLEPWLQELGITIEGSLVLDKQHGQYALPVSRKNGGLRVRETDVVNYPYIIDVRGDGLNIESGITARLGQMYVPWASPVVIDPQQSNNRMVTPLLYSSNKSWSSNSDNILPDFVSNPELGFDEPSNGSKPYVLAAMIEGSFDTELKNSNSSRLIVVGSSALFTDNFADQMSQVLRTEYRRPVQFLHNLVEWSIEDQGLLGVLRKHSQFTRTLTTLTEQEKTQWEYLNYALGAIGLALIGLIRIILYRKSKLRGIKLLQGL